jgi:hypothetical protein
MVMGLSRVQECRLPPVHEQPRLLRFFPVALARAGLAPLNGGSDAERPIPDQRME